MRTKMSIKKFWSITLIGAAFFISACSGSPPIDKIANVEMLINQARENNASTYAPLELKFAQEKLIEAKVMVDNKLYEKARLTAEEAMIDAKLAEAKSRASKAKKLANEMKDSIDTLRDEIDRTYQNSSLNEEALY